MFRLFRIGLYALLGAAATPWFALSQSTPPLFRSSSELVVVDLVAVDRHGRFVSDLRPDEIDLREDGRRQPVQILRRIGGPPEETAVWSTPSTTVEPRGILDPSSPWTPSLRPLVIVIDAVTLPPEAVPHIRQALADVLRDLPLGFPVALASIADSLVVHQSLTTDRQLLAAALDNLRPVPSAPTRSVAVFEAVDRTCAASADPKRVMDAAIEAGERFVLEEGARSRRSASALTELLTSLRALEGRKHLVLYSAGHSISPTTEALDAISAAVSGCTGGDPLMVRRQAAESVSPLSTSDAADAMRSTIAQANEAQVTFYTLDPAGITMDAVPPEFRGSSRTSGAAVMIPAARLRGDGGRDYLKALADDTGGLTVESNDMQALVRRASQDAGEYYLIGYAPPPGKRQFRTIKVSVKRSGVSVRYRRGYSVIAGPPSSPDREKAPAAPPARSGGGGKSTADREGSVSTPAADRGATSEVLSAAADYVDRLVARLSNVVLDETLEQTLTMPPLTWGTNSRIPVPGPVTRRELVAEFLLVRPPGTVYWIPLRDVVKVDGRELGNRSERIVEILTTGRGTLSQAARIAAESGAYQLGGRTRTATNPVIALAFLQPHHQNRFHYRAEKVRDDRQGRRVNLRFEETRRPTLMRTDDDQDLPMRGMFEIDLDTGAVLKSELSLTTLAENVVLRTRYVFNEVVETNLPAEMTETHVMKNGAILSTVAHYGRVRRFSVSTSEVYK